MPDILFEKVVRIDVPLVVTVQPDAWPTNNGSPDGTLIRTAVTYWRPAQGAVEIADRLGEFWSSTPLRPDDVDVDSLVAEALGTPGAPCRTPLREIKRIPAAGTGWFTDDGAVTGADTGFMHTVRAKAAAGPAADESNVLARLGEAIRDLLDWLTPGGAMVAHGAGAGSAFLLAHQPNGTGGAITVTERPAMVAVSGRGRWAVEDLMAELPTAWPVLWPRHLPAALAVLAAARAGVPAVVTGHDLHRLLSASPTELAALKTGRWTGEATFALPTRPHYRRPTKRPVTAPVGAPGTGDGPWAWLTSEGASRVGAASRAGQLARHRWAEQSTGRVTQLLAAWAEPGLSWLVEIARRAGVRLVFPAWRPEILPTVLELPLRLRARAEHGLIRNAPLLHGPEVSARAGGEHRCRLAAVRWAAGPAGAIALDRLARGYLVETGVLDGALVRQAATDPFIRTRQALTLHRLSYLDSWLGAL